MDGAADYEGELQASQGAVMDQHPCSFQRHGP
jgi:hypothetical protein